MPFCGARMSMRLSWSSAAILLLDQLRHLAADVGEVLADLGAHVLIDLQDLDLGLGDLALRLRDRGDELAALAVEPRACSRSSAVTRVNWTSCFSHKVADAVELLLDPVDLLVLGVDLRGKAADLLLRLRDALVELRLQALARVAADLEQLASRR